MTLEEMNEKLDKIIEMLSDRSKEVFTEETEEVIMDLTKVQCIAVTDKAILVTKEGYQKWIPLSQISENTKTIEAGDFLEEIELIEKAKKWIPDKSWDKFKVVKNRG